MKSNDNASTKEILLSQIGPLFSCIPLGRDSLLLVLFPRPQFQGSTTGPEKFNFLLSRSKR